MFDAVSIDMNVDHTLPTQVDDGFRGVRDALQQAWPDLTDEDIDRAHGSVLRLIGRIEERTGQMHWEIQARLQQILTRHGLGHAGGAPDTGYVPT